MNITREDLPGRQVALTIELDPETVNTALDRAYRQMVNQVNIPGFRKGKAPRYLVERYVGTEALTERAVRNILPDTLQEAIQEQDIDALDVGDLEIVNMEPVTVRVVVVQNPLVELGDYSSIRVDKETTDITQEQIDQVFQELRRDGAPWNEPTEPRPVKEGDMVYVDLEGFSGEGEIESVKREDFPTIIGLERAGIPDVVNAALVGMNVGEEKDVTETMPEDYPDESLRGRDVSYHVTVKSMKEQQLPEMTDEWAKGLGFDTVDALKEAVERNLKQRTEETAESNQVNQIISQLVERSHVDVPHVMIHEELDAMLKNLENRLKEQRLTLRQYFTFNGISEAEWRDRNHEQAEERVIRGLVLQEFARKEGVSVDSAEVESEIDDMLNAFEGDQKEQARSVLTQGESKSDLQNRIYNRKVVDKLVAIAEGREEAQFKPEPKAEEAAAASTETAEEAVAGNGAAEEETTADNLEAAGGAAEVLNAEEPRSENETGEAADGGTPPTAPGLQTEA